MIFSALVALVSVSRPANLRLDWQARHCQLPGSPTQSETFFFGRFMSGWCLSPRTVFPPESGWILSLSGSKISYGNSPFNPDIHLTVRAIQADSLINPWSFRIYNIDPSRLLYLHCYRETWPDALYAPKHSIYITVALLLAHFFSSQMAPIKPPRAFIHHSIYSLLCWSPWLFYWP